MTAGNHAAVRCVNGVWRGATTAVPQKEAQRGAQTETAMKVTGEGSPLETPPMTGEEGMESGTVETTEREVWGKGL